MTETKKGTILQYMKKKLVSFWERIIDRMKEIRGFKVVFASTEPLSSLLRPPTPNPADGNVIATPVFFSQSNVLSGLNCRLLTKHVDSRRYCPQYIHCSNTGNILL